MSVSSDERRLYLAIHIFYGQKETYKVVGDEPFVKRIGMGVSTPLRWLITYLSMPGVCTRADAQVLWCEWHDKGTGKSMLLYADEGGVLGGKPDCEPVLDMTVGDVFSTGSADDATHFEGHVELRAWYGKEWGTESRIF